MKNVEDSMLCEMWEFAVFVTGRVPRISDFQPEQG